MMRRIADVVVSSVVIVLLAPIFLLVAIAIRIDSPGKVIYKGWRIGQGGRRFPMYKFRSMVSDADRRGSVVTSKADSRITRVGYFLRATKIDEFPQFWNVLSGDMTLIGPRPEAPEFVELYTPEQRRVLDAKPGLTGPSQISCTVDESMAVLNDQTAEHYYIQHVLGRRLAIDAEYLRHRNLFSDLALIGQTVGLILRALVRNRV